MVDPPEIFLSYSYDNADHEAWVDRLARDLTERGISVIYDKWDVPLGSDLTLFMDRAVGRADRVLLVCTESYVEKAEAATGGVGYERLLVTREIFAKVDTDKFVPLMRANEGRGVPAFLGARRFIDFSADDDYDARIEDLARELLGVPANPRPAIGANPYTTTAPAPPPGNDIPDLTHAWWASRSERSLTGLTSVGLTGSMEVRAAALPPTSHHQTDLVDAVAASQIKTFGWPIAIMMNSPEWRPRPTPDGIEAEVAFEARPSSGVPSYDLWAVGSDGQFFLQQSLFEDQRSKNQIFFNTRIVRVAETLMFLRALYGRLGVAEDATALVQISHRGLRGRHLASAGRDRWIEENRIIRENEVTTLLEAPLAALRTDLAANVESILAPLFVLFDFAKFDKAVYEDIVGRFEASETT